jgi:ATP-dependent DNA helicase RecG
VAFTLLDQPAQFLRGVGPKRAEALGRVGVHTARDLLYHVPRRYEDASTVTPIGKAEVGSDVTVIGTVFSKGVLPTRSGLRIFQAVLRDETGSIECSWPGQPFLDRSIQRGDTLLVTGSVRFFQGRQIQPREFIVLSSRDEEGDGAGKVLPIYPSTEGLSQRMIRQVVDQNLDRLLPGAVAEDALPPEERRLASVPPLAEALEMVHRPATLMDAERGRRRLSYDELLSLQLLHARVRARTEEQRQGRAFQRTDQVIAPLFRSLPFQLTGAQERALREIFSDMESPRQMHRLVQGDVGSGKTVVALFAMALAVEGGCQAALMAPTELLAEQHARSLARMLEPAGLDVVLLTGRLGAADRRRALERMASGDARVVVGTHALIQEGVVFHRLGLAVIDEQHRFGVRQRLALSAMGESVDTLVMSATPIPRSLALTLYGDLDLTVIDEVPPNRRPVKTALRAEEARSRVHAFIREQVQEGRQAYIVYPLIEESDRTEARAAAAEFERLRDDVFPDLRLGLLHGQLPSDEKDSTMRSFAAGDIDVLVATTVIEVGIDVANATVMLIEHAERFGLSQLHQLRGRVGRGAAESFCILLTDAQHSERLRIFAATEDGFAIARADLQIRGMGDFFGSRQHGLPEFRFFRAELDEDLLELARERAHAILLRDPGLERAEHAGLARLLGERFADRARLFQVG